MGIVCINKIDGDMGDESRRIVEVPSDVARRLAALRREQSEHSGIRSDALMELISQIELQVANERILRLVNRRDYSRRELKERLLRDGYDNDVCDEVLDGLIKCGIVSDSRYAEIYIRSKLAAGWGVERIVRELESRGVDVNGLEGWPYEYLDPEAELERAAEVARKKCSGSRSFSYPQIVRFLMGRGFSYGVACGAAKKTI